MMQYVISTKAGLVNYVQGNANVKATATVPMGTPIKTGPEGFAEILLNPGSYLRLGPDSEAVLEGIELVNVSIRLVAGSAVIEATGFSKEMPLRVTSKDLNLKIIKDGVYSFAGDEVRIVEGQLQIDGNKTVYKKGWVVSKTTAYKAPKDELQTVELWSRNRSKLIAAANTNIANSLRRSSGPPSWYDVWLWDPSFGAYTYMPGYRFRSPYGYRYRSIQETYYPGGNSAGNSAADASRAGGGSNSSGGFGGGSSGGSSGGGGGFSPPPVRADPPSRPSMPSGHDSRPAQP
jgi:uncharacterized membrane protein YgcG